MILYLRVNIAINSDYYFISRYFKTILSVIVSNSVCNKYIIVNYRNKNIDYIIVYKLTVDQMLIGSIT